MISMALEYIKPILSYWKLILAGLIVVIIAGLLTDVYIKSLKITNLQSQLDVKDMKIHTLGFDLKLSNDAALANKLDYEVKLKQLPKEIVKIHTVYVPKYQTIETITEDKNDTCEQMVANLNNTDL